jgi:hypothetical protein
MKFVVVVGRRNSGKSSVISDMLCGADRSGRGSGVVIVTDTDGDFEHHRKNSPDATVLKLPPYGDNNRERSLRGILFDQTGHTKTIAIDNVTTDPLDPMLAKAAAETVIVAVSHPCMVPLSHPSHPADGSRARLVLLSSYPRYDDACILNLKSTYAFELAANVPQVAPLAGGKTRMAPWLSISPALNSAGTHDDAPESHDPTKWTWLPRGASTTTTRRGESSRRSRDGPAWPASST